MVNDNGTLMGIQCLKYFPSMSKEFVSTVCDNEPYWHIVKINFIGRL